MLRTSSRKPLRFPSHCIFINICIYILYIYIFMCNMQAMSPLCLLHLRRASCILFQREGTRGHVCYRRRRYVPVASSVNAIVCLPLPGLPQAVWRCSAGSFFGEGRRCCGGGSACCSPDTTGPRRRIACGPSEVCGQRRWWGDGSVRGILPTPVKVHSLSVEQVWMRVSYSTSYVYRHLDVRSLPLSTKCCRERLTRKTRIHCGCK